MRCRPPRKCGQFDIAEPSAVIIVHAAKPHGRLSCGTEYCPPDCPTGHASSRAKTSEQHSRRSLTPRRTLELEPMCAVNNAVQDRVPNCVVRDNFMPSVDGDLTGDQQRSFLVAIIDNFQQVTSLFGGQWLRSPVVDDEQPGALKRCHEAREASFTAGRGQLGKQT